MNWTKEKPVLDHECILLTLAHYNYWDLLPFYVTKIEYDGDWYWGICDVDGNEWGDYSDLEVEYYMIVEFPITKEMEQLERREKMRLTMLDKLEKLREEEENKLKNKENEKHSN